jgi:hypothetical protein
MSTKPSQSRKQKEGSMRQRAQMRIPGSVRQYFPGVKKVVDATANAAVAVEQQDCQGGEQLQPDECALARAIKREGRGDGAIVGLSYSYVVSGRTATRYRTPETVGREITSFDRHGDFAPGNYLLSAPSPSQRLGSRPGRAKGKRTKAQQDRRIVHKKTVRVREMPRGGHGN